MLVREFTYKKVLVRVWKMWHEPYRYQFAIQGCHWGATAYSLEAVKKEINNYLGRGWTLDSDGVLCPPAA